MALSDQLNVLFIDDEADNLDAFVFNCEEFWNTRTVMDPRDIVSGRYSVKGHDAIMVDLIYNFPEVSPEDHSAPLRGLEVLAWLQENHPEIPTMVLSAFLTSDIRREIAQKYPKVMCLDKPLDFSRAAFREMVQNFIEEYKAGNKPGLPSESSDPTFKET